MSLPTSPTSATKTIPSYLYFQYQTDEDLPSLIQSYNTMSQEVIDWFNNLNLPIYTLQSGDLLDWVGAGIYGYPRPQLSSYTQFPPQGATATYPTARYATADMVRTSSSYGVKASDDVYKRCLTWQFYKGDGFQFTIPWLKRRVYRWMNGTNGTSPDIAYTSDVGITFSKPGSITVYFYQGPTASMTTSFGPTASLKRTAYSQPVYFAPTITIDFTGYSGTLISQFIDSINSGAITFPFQYTVVVTS